MAWRMSDRMGSKLFVLANILLIGGCNLINGLGPNCDRSPTNNEAIVYNDGTTQNGLYMSSPWAGELLWFPGGMRYELPHGLGETPHFVDAWLAFDQCGTRQGTVARAAGNQAEVRTIDKDKLIIVNGSCSDYWLLVVAGTGDEAPSPPTTETDASQGDGVCLVDGGDGGDGG